MQFILTPDSTTAVLDLQQRIISELQADKKVLWLVSGGSNISAATTIMAHISAELQPDLTVMLIDERFGPIGHADSNFQQLLDAGFEAGQARLIPVLEEGLSLEATATNYNSVVQAEFGKADIIIAQLGVGEDGHISGILPGSPAVDATDVLVTSYVSDPYQRITTTFRALQAIDVDYSFVYGDSKHQALERLQTELPLSQLPSQILKQLSEAYIYNDHIGDPA